MRGLTRNRVRLLKTKGLLPILLAAVLSGGCVTAYATQERAIVSIVGSPAVTVCEVAPEGAVARPCIEVKGAAISEQGSNVIKTVAEVVWAGIKLLIPLL